MEFSIVIIRHGNTFATERNLYCGSTDINLSLKGKKEINLYKNNNIYPSCDVFFTSEKKRAIETIKLIYGKYIKYKTIKHLNEQNLGNLDMKSYEDIKDIDIYRNWLSDTTGDVKCPNGESLNHFKLRVKIGLYELLEEIKLKNIKSSFLVTHGGVISIIMESIFPNKKSPKAWIPTPGLGYIIYYSNESFTNYKELLPIDKINLPT